eukprot:g20119.t1
MKKKREQVWKKFTEPGEPGESLRPYYESMEMQLLAEGRMVGTGMVIAAFFELVAELIKNGRSFSIVFRTFGSDLPAVQAEFNAFCAGQHPRYPDMRLDGSAQGKPDLRLVAENTGSWYRAADDLSIDLHIKTSQPSVLALRDYFPYWQKGGQHGPYGKLLPVNPTDHRCHAVFFDDNVTLDTEDTKIVDVRDTTGKEAWLHFLTC